MTNPFERLRDVLDEIGDDIEAELDRQRERFRYTVERGKVRFDSEVRQRHRAARERLGSFLSHTRPLVVLTSPLIYSLIFPFAILDLFVWVYQAVCFPIYGIKKVPRSDFIAIDRHHLQYLNGLQKLNCVYCGYCNGVIAWVREVAGRTEAYWCPIKHARKLAGPHNYYAGFTDYGDASAFQDHVEHSRKGLKPMPRGEI
jgi:hypothetical protein